MTADIVIEDSWCLLGASLVLCSDLWGLFEILLSPSSFVNVLIFMCSVEAIPFHFLHTPWLSKFIKRSQIKILACIYVGGHWY